MTLTDAELAAVGRLMSWKIGGISRGQMLDGRGEYRNLEYAAADVLSKLVAEGAMPVLTDIGEGVAQTYDIGRFEAQYGPERIDSRSFLNAETWPLAVLKAAAAYQLAKDSK